MVTRVDRRAFLATVGATTLAGCIGARRNTGDGVEGLDAADPSPTTADSPSTLRRGGPPTAAERLPVPFPPAEVGDRAVSGGVPKDGIPAIEDPSFVSAGEADEWLRPADPVFGVVTAAAAVKAYPQRILVWHEICNDVVGETPVSVTYCPLTGTAMGFLRGETSFGVSGRLVSNNLVMYDRATETWWPQVLATAVPGAWNPHPAIESLAEFRLVWTTWERWSAAHPETLVLSRDTGHARNYDRDPYGSYDPVGGYYAPDARPMFPTLSEDDRLPPKQVVIGARTPEGAVAFEKDAIREAGVVEGTLGERAVTAVHDPRLDTGYVYATPGDVAVEYDDGEVGIGHGGSHAPDSLPLERVLAFDAMWFAWSSFYPTTSLHG